MTCIGSRICMSMVMFYNCDGLYSTAVVDLVSGPSPICSYVMEQALVYS